jgi:hypothetical protein
MPGPSFWTMQVNVTDVCASSTPRMSNPLVPKIQCGLSLQDMLERAQGTAFTVYSGFSIKLRFVAAAPQSGFIISRLSIRFFDFKRKGSVVWQTLRVQSAVLDGTSCSGNNLCVGLDPLDSIFDSSPSEISIRAWVRARLTLISYDSKKRLVEELSSIEEDVDQPLDLSESFVLPAAQSIPAVSTPRKGTDSSAPSEQRRPLEQGQDSPSAVKNVSSAASTIFAADTTTTLFVVALATAISIFRARLL